MNHPNKQGVYDAMLLHYEPKNNLIKKNPVVKLTLYRFNPAVGCRND